MRELRPGVWELSISDAGTRRYRTARGTHDDAASALAAFVAETASHYDSLDTLIVAYLRHLEAEGRSPATLRRYRQLWRQWLSPTLAELTPATVRSPDLEAGLVAMADAGQSSSSLHQAAILLSGCFVWAKGQGMLGTNPAFSLSLPDGTRLASPRLRWG